MTPRVVLLADVEPQAWHNGGGRTRELLAWPDASRWQLRISVAEIERDGPFSAFPGTERWFTVISGAGVVLGFDTQRTIKPDDSPIHFDGGLAPGCHLIDGPTQDLNLMLRGQPGRMLAVQPGQRWHSAAPLRGLYAAAPGHWRDSRGHSQPVPADSLLWCEGAPPSGSYCSFDARGWWIAAGPAEGLQ